MKAPKPQPPTNMPQGTRQIGGAIEWFSVSVGVKGVELVPAEVTELLGRSPDQAQQEGQPLFRSDGSVKRIPRFGAWWAELKRDQTDEWDCAEAIRDLLSTMETDVSVWRTLGAKYEVAIRVGLSLEFSGAGFELPHDLLAYLGERGISVGFEVYSEGPING